MAESSQPPELSRRQFLTMSARGGAALAVRSLPNPNLPLLKENTQDEEEALILKKDLELLHKYGDFLGANFIAGHVLSGERLINSQAVRIIKCQSNSPRFDLDYPGENLGKDGEDDIRGGITLFYNHLEMPNPRGQLVQAATTASIIHYLHTSRNYFRKENGDDPEKTMEGVGTYRDQFPSHLEIARTYSLFGATALYNQLGKESNYGKGQETQFQSGKFGLIDLPGINTQFPESTKESPFRGNYANTSEWITAVATYLYGVKDRNGNVTIPLERVGTFLVAHFSSLKSNPPSEEFFQESIKRGFMGKGTLDAIGDLLLTAGIKFKNKKDLVI